MSKVEEVSTTVRSQIVLASNRVRAAPFAASPQCAVCRAVRPSSCALLPQATELVWGPTPDEPRKVELHVSLPRSDIPVVTSRDGRVLALVPFETDTVHVYDTATCVQVGLRLRPVGGWKARRSLHATTNSYALCFVLFCFVCVRVCAYVRWFCVVGAKCSGVHCLAKSPLGHKPCRCPPPAGSSSRGTARSEATQKVRGCP